MQESVPNTDRVCQEDEHECVSDDHRPQRIMSLTPPMNQRFEQTGSNARP